MPDWYLRWRERHRNPVSMVLHVVGIPMTILCIPLITVQIVEGQWDLWWRPVALLAGGYFLQWLGHVIEGNDMGEVILIKKLLGKPYVAIAPRYRKQVAASRMESTAALNNAKSATSRV